jgi:hypothetical protein
MKRGTEAMPDRAVITMPNPRAVFSTSKSVDQGLAIISVEMVDDDPTLVARFPDGSMSRYPNRCTAGRKVRAWFEEDLAKRRETDPTLAIGQGIVRWPDDVVASKAYAVPCR